MKKLFSALWVGIIFLFLYFPLLVMVAFSFNSTTSKSVFTGFSLKWYAELFSDPQLMGALGNTLLVAVLAALVATVLGTAAAIGIHSYPKRARNAVMNISNVPIINPEIVTGISLMLMFVMVAGWLRLPMGFWSVLLAHITFNVPYVVLNVLPKLRQMNSHLYEAALDLGAPPRRALWRVVLPEIMPGIASGFLMSLTYSMDDFVITRFTSGNFQTLPVLIYTMLKKPLPLSVNALSALLFLMVLSILIAINVISAKRYKKEQKELAK
ncbi:MAG: ABC transporter permease [Clostridia bacterium]|nr:ABC transporter permease [Clostridia bacterium]